jgi:hypothetical protein
MSATRPTVQSSFGAVRPGDVIVIEGQSDVFVVRSNRRADNGFERRLTFVDGAPFRWLQGMPDWPLDVVIPKEGTT